MSQRSFNECVISVLTGFEKRRFPHFNMLVFVGPEISEKTKKVIIGLGLIYGAGDENRTYVVAGRLKFTIELHPQQINGDPWADLERLTL